MTERLLHLFTVLATAAGLGLLAWAPEAAIVGWGHPVVPGTVHLLTLGGVLGAAYLAQHATWRALYGPAALWRPLLAGVLVFQAAGVVLFAWGLLEHNTLLAYVGGHYGVPTGIVLALADGWVAAWRRPPGTPRHAAAHLPGLGLVVAMSIGALLVMDAHTGRYGIYTPATIGMHLLAAGFLFVVPQILLPGALWPAPADEHTPSDPLAALRWYAAVGTGALGVLFTALALADAGPARMLPMGLAMLGALLVWLGLPAGGLPRRGSMPHGGAWAPLAGRLATGVLLFYAAMRVGGGPVLGDVFWLGRVGVLLFVAGIALPELLAALEPRADARGTDRRRVLWLAATAVLLAGQVWAVDEAVRAGAALWLAGLAWHAVAVQRGGLRELP